MGIIGSWLKVNSLKINVTKTNFMLIRDPRKLIGANYRCKIIVEDRVIKEIVDTKYLGIIIDNNLLFNKQAA